MPAPVQVSFVIPARNEAEHIGACVDSIHAAVRDRWTYEIVVVDHGSTDGTAQIAKQRGATVLDHPGGTIGQARNAGAKATSGGAIAFIDGDIVLEPEWRTGLERALANFRQHPKTAMGALCGISCPPSWIERIWFDPAKRPQVNHLPGANILIPRSLFVEIGGFDAALTTGEDYDLCRRVELAGGRIVLDKGLAVQHLGFPRTLRQFIRRESWHGSGDFASIQGVRSSRVAQAAIVFVLLHAAALGAAPRWPLAALAALMGIVSLCAASALAKYRKSSGGEIVQLTFLYYTYFLGRSMSLFRSLGRALSPRVREVVSPAPGTLS